MTPQPYMDPDEERMMLIMLLIFAGIFLTILAHAFITTP